MILKSGAITYMDLMFEVQKCKDYPLKPRTTSKGKHLDQIPLVILSQDLFTFGKNGSFWKETMGKIAPETSFLTLLEQKLSNWIDIELEIKYKNKRVK